jgi:hypothetical protein
MLTKLEKENFSGLLGYLSAVCKLSIPAGFQTNILYAFFILQTFGTAISVVDHSNTFKKVQIIKLLIM